VTNKKVTDNIKGQKSSANALSLDVEGETQVDALVDDHLARVTSLEPAEELGHSQFAHLARQLRNQKISPTKIIIKKKKSDRGFGFFRFALEQGQLEGVVVGLERRAKAEEARHVWVRNSARRHLGQF
jgi:hypothetical protein